MKKTLFVIILLMSSRLLAIAPIGPATGNLKKGWSSLTVEYAHTEADFTGKASGFAVGDFTGKVLRFVVDEKAKCDGFYGKYAYSVVDGSELFVRFGVAKFAGEDEGDIVSLPDYDFAWGFGAKTTLAKSGNVSWGLLAQVTWWRAESDVTSADYDLQETDKGYSVQVAGGPVFKADALSVYGGPVLFFTKGDERCTGRVADRIVNFSGDIEQDLQLGGYIGLSLELAKTVDLNVEYQLSADTAVFGIGLTCRF